LSAGIDLTVATGAWTTTGATITSAVADCVTVASMTCDETTHHTKDYGASHFSGNFTLKGALNISALTAASSQYMGQILTLSNTSTEHSNNNNARQGIRVHHVSNTSYYLALIESTGSATNISSASSTLTANAPYWIQIYRDTSVGTYGTLYLKIFSDPAYTIQVGSTLTITLAGSVSFRYLHLVESFDNNQAGVNMSLTIGGVSVNLFTSTALALSATEGNDSLILNLFSGARFSLPMTEGDDTFSSGQIELKNIIQLIATEDDDTMYLGILAINPTTTILQMTEGDDAGQINLYVPFSSSIVGTEGDDTLVAVITLTSTVITETMYLRIFHKTTGQPITGLTAVYVQFMKESNSHLFDFDDNAFKASPTTPTGTLTEVDATNQPGRYKLNVIVTSWDGWIVGDGWYIDGDSFRYNFELEAFYVSGIRTHGSWLAAEVAQIADIDAEVDEININVDRMATDLAEINSRIPAALVGGKMSSDLGSIGGSVAALTYFRNALGTGVSGTISTVAFTPTLTEFEAGDIAEDTTDNYNGRIIIFTSGDILGQAAEITGYYLQAGLGHFTVSALTSIPVNGTTFVIV